MKAEFHYQFTPVFIILSKSSSEFLIQLVTNIPNKVVMLMMDIRSQ